MAKKFISIDQYCPLCYQEGKITSLFLEDNNELCCPTHNLVGYKDSKVGQYKEVEETSNEQVIGQLLIGSTILE